MKAASKLQAASLTDKANIVTQLRVSSMYTRPKFKLLFRK